MGHAPEGFAVCVEFAGLSGSAGGLSGGARRCGNRQQAVPTETVGVVGGNEVLVFGGQPDTIALALGDIAHPAFEGGLTAGAIFGRSLGDGELGYGGLGHGECGFETGPKVRNENVCWRATDAVIHSVLPVRK